MNSFSLVACSSFGDELWNRLVYESCSSMATNVADDALPTDAAGDRSSPGQPLANRSAPASPVDQQPPPLQPSTLTAADVNFQRMRSSSVTLGRESATPWPAVGSSRVHRSYSFASMAAPFPAKCRVTESEHRGPESVRQPPPSWMRASMRLVRPFQLADPPAGQPAASSAAAIQAVQIQLPPVFPCAVLERPSSAPVSDRPRQYGRRVREQATSASSPASPASAVVAASTIADRVVAAATLGSRVRSGRRCSDGDRRTCDGRSARDRATRDSDNRGRSVRDNSVGPSSVPRVSRAGQRSPRTPVNSVQTAVGDAARRVVSPRRRQPAPGSNGRTSGRTVPSTSG